MRNMTDDGFDKQSRGRDGFAGSRMHMRNGLPYTRDKKGLFKQDGLWHNIT